MAEPIYKFFLGRPSAAWYQLAQEEQQALLARADAAFQACGGKHLMVCDTSWSTDQWRYAGVEVYPDLASLQGYMEALNKMNWYYYSENISAIGTQAEAFALDT